MNENYKNRIAELLKEDNAYQQKMAECTKEIERIRKYVLATLEELKDTVQTINEVVQKVKECRNCYTDYWNGAEKNGLIHGFYMTESIINEKVQEISKVNHPIEYWNRKFKEAEATRVHIKGMYETVCEILERNIAHKKEMLNSVISNGSKEYEKVIQ